MEKTRGKDILKVAVVSALAIGMFSAAFMGANSLALAAATSGTEIIPPIAEPVSVTQNLPPEGFVQPNLTVIASPALNGHANNIVSAHAMPMEEAAGLGAQYIWDVFGESIDGMYVEMLFANWPSNSRTYWIGTVRRNRPVEVPDIETSVDAQGRTYIANETVHIEARIYNVNNVLYRFMIDAVTGLRVSISPWSGTVAMSCPKELEAAMYLRTSPERIEWQKRWQDMDAHARMVYLGLTSEDIEAYAQTARGFTERHFNNSTVVDFSDGVPHVGIVIDNNGNAAFEFTSVTFTATDDTGREAIVTIEAGTHSLSASGIVTEHNDFIPGFSYNRPGIEYIG